MFRKMRRFKQQLSDEETKNILKTEKRGVLSVLGDDGYPYGIPLDFIYDENENKFYFHCGKSGHKIDAVKACDKASFCVFDRGYKKEGDWAYTVKSVIAFGRVKVVEDEKTRDAEVRRLAERFPCGEEYINHEFKHSGPALQCLELDVEHMTGKLVHEA